MKLNHLLLCLVFALTCSCAGSVPPGDSGEIYQKTPSAPASSKRYKIMGKYYQPLASARGFSQKGIASWYGKKFHGRKTANGETYNMYAMTAAHKTLPLGTWVRVHNLSNNKKAVVRVNDRGPFVRGRIIDLSYTAARKLDVAGPGTAPVKIYALGRAADKGSKDKPSQFKPVNYWKGNFTVQVGAFKVRQNALNLKAKLLKRYGSGHITVHRDSRGRFYRVRTGKYTNLEAAADFRDKLLYAGASNAFVVAE
ncbi:MAG: septal ring lytic transglycosylase RlpA family protein [Desulfobacteraceae bacterium]